MKEQKNAILKNRRTERKNEKSKKEKERIIITIDRNEVRKNE